MGRPRKEHRDGLKHCPDCDTWKALEGFPRHARAWDGLYTYCKDCANSRTIARRYGLSWEEYQAMRAQGCTVCGGHHRLCVDHNHTNGRVRAMLCTTCNSMLGMARDDPARLRSGAEYLEGWQREHA